MGAGVGSTTGIDVGGGVDVGGADGEGVGSGVTKDGDAVGLAVGTSGQNSRLGGPKSD